MVIKRYPGCLRQPGTSSDKLHRRTRPFSLATRSRDCSSRRTLRERRHRFWRPRRSCRLRITTRERPALARWVYLLRSATYTTGHRSQIKALLPGAVRRLACVGATCQFRLRLLGSSLTSFGPRRPLLALWEALLASKVWGPFVNTGKSCDVDKLRELLEMLRWV